MWTTYGLVPFTEEQMDSRCIVAPANGAADTDMISTKISEQRREKSTTELP